MSLDHKPTPPADLLIRGAHVLDPRTGIDARLDVRVENGVIAELAEPNTLEHDGETIDGEGRHVFPGFVDPPPAVITAQVAAGVVVRMAVLYEVLAHVPNPARAPEGVPA